MQRQVWIFLSDDDEQDLIARLSEGRSLRVLPGRYFRGSLEALRDHDEAPETLAALPNERWLHLIDTEASRVLVAHALTDGPHAGWSRLDDVRSEVLTLVRPRADAQGLAPSRLQASTHAWFSGDKIRKSREFTKWTAQALGLAEAAYPPTGFDWMRVAPGAHRFARDGGRLHYLYKSVPLEPGEDSRTTPPSRPHQGSW